MSSDPSKIQTITYKSPNFVHSKDISKEGSICQAKRDFACSYASGAEALHVLAEVVGSLLIG